MEHFAVITASEEFLDAAFREVQKADPKTRLLKTLGPGVALISTGLDFENLSGILTLQEPVFARHINPVQLIIPLKNEPEDLSLLATGVATLPEARTLLEQDTPFSVQARFAGDNPQHSYSAFAVKEAVAAELSRRTGAVENVREPEIVVSVVIVEGEAFAGISRVEENLSGWAGGMRRYAHTPEQISRAEFKLLEALEVFGLELPKGGEALDLGAAPGGWTRLLLEAGMHVVAVDPADMDPRLSDNPNLEHYRGLAAEYLRLAQRQQRQFDIIASDMRMDAQLAATVMASVAGLLAPQGFALTTLKLPHAAPKLDPVKIMNRALETLAKVYPTVRAKQLFHNRQEVIVLLRKS